MSQLLRSAAAALACSALTGCFGFLDPYGGSSSSSSSSSYNYNYNADGGYDPPSSTQGGASPAPSLPLESCVALEVESKDQLSADVLGTWQDWNGGSMKLTTFTEDGKVTVSAFPSDAAGLPDETLAPVVELSGTWVVSDGKLAIKWENGKKEVDDTFIESYPGCTMLEITLGDSETSQLPNPSQLERVSCPMPPAPQTGLVH
jgi:hypothetical protein